MFSIDRLHVREFTEAHLLELVTGEASEASGRFDFKREIKLATDDDKKEFCLDAASFANAGGGLLLFGIDEADAVATSVPGIEVASVDEMHLRIDNVLATNISPRLPSYELGLIELASKRFVLALRVPRSANAPHAVVKTGLFRFYTRTTAGKYPMDMPQVRQAFALAEGLRERLRMLRVERVGRILANEGIARLDAGAKLILQLVPLEMLSNPRRFDVLRYHAPQNQDLCSMGCRFPYGKQINIDGVVDIYGNDEKTGLASGYVQLYEQGAIEAADAVLLRSSDNAERYMNSLSAPYVASNLVASCNRYLQILRDLQVAAPVYVFVSMTGIRGRRLFYDNYHHAPVRCDRDDLYFQEAVLTDLSAQASDVLRPVLDSFFRAFGSTGCTWYQADGSLKIP